MSWIESLPEELREAPYIAKAESPKDALAKIQHAAKLVGTSVRLPGEDADEAAYGEFYEKIKDVPGLARLPGEDDIDGVVGLLSKLGYPDDPSKYEPATVEDFEWDDGALADLRKYAHEAGMTPGQFRAFTQRIAEAQAKAEAEDGNARENELQALKAEWGAALDDRKALIRGWLTGVEAPADLREDFEAGNLSAGTMKWLYGIAEQFKDETNPIAKDGQGGEPKMTPEDARIKFSEVMAQLSDMRESDPRYAKLKAQLVPLQQLAMGG